MQTQNAYERHLLALYRLRAPINCKTQPTTFSSGTTRVSGTEKDERIEVMVEMQIELHCPPEQIVRGIDKEENMLSKIYLTRDFSSDCEGSTKLSNEYSIPLNNNSSNDRRCRTSHLSSSNPPVMPPSFFIAFEIVRVKRMRRRQATTYLARLSPWRFLY